MKKFFGWFCVLALVCVTTIGCQPADDGGSETTTSSSDAGGEGSDTQDEGSDSH